MRRLPAIVVALLLVAAMTTAITVGAVAWVIRDHDSPGRGMMGPLAGAPGWWDGSRGSMMGMAGWGDLATEPGYLAEMIAHHQEAVTSARELARSDRAEMRSLGASIVKTQTAQIRQMQAWLREWYPEQFATADYQPMMRDLSGLSGDRLDQTFLQDMIRHHMVAVMMSQQLLWRGVDHDAVAELARSIRDDQSAEIVEMQRWLAQWFDTDWRGGMGWGMGW
jgi:uncharacterized protein (DUF305 family)